MRLFTSLLFLVLIGHSAVANESDQIQGCLGNIETFIPEKDIQACTQLLVSKSLSSHNRAQILIQLGTAVQFSGAQSTTQMEEKSLESIELYKKAIESEPRYVEAYLILATALKLKERTSEALKVLDAGLTVIPDDPRLIADKSVILAKTEHAKDVEKLCTLAVSSKHADQSVYEECARALAAAGFVEQADGLFKKATQNEDRMSRKRFGLWQSGRIGFDYAQFLDQQGRSKEAAEFFDAHLLKIPSQLVSRSERQFLAELFTKIGSPDRAAKLLSTVAAASSPSSAFKIKLLELQNLTKSGDMSAARSLAQFMFEGASKNQILQLQVKLKNGTQKQLKITGKYDAITIEALDNCLNDKECFSDSASPRL
jgi:tetratricopeptide (TPR) repeat protein